MQAAIPDGDHVDVVFDVNAPSVCIPKDFLNNEKFDSITVKLSGGPFGTATVKVPSNAVKSSDLSECFAISISGSDSYGGSTAAFELDITGSLTTVFDSKVTVSVGANLPSGATNVRFYCLDSGEYVRAVYKGGNVTAALDHFSTWTIYYDIPDTPSKDKDKDKDKHNTDDYYEEQLKKQRAAEEAAKKAEAARKAEAAKRAEAEQKKETDLLVAVVACTAFIVACATAYVVIRRR